MLIFKIKRFDELVDNMKTWILTQSVGLTNWNPGSGVRSIIEAVAIKIEELYFKVYFALIAAIPTAIYEGFDFSRIQGIKAVGMLQFSCVGASHTDYLIPAGTVVQTPGGVRFQVTATDAKIKDGFTTSGDVSAEALNVGVAGNVSNGTITIMVTTLTGITAVTNAAKFSYGSDFETDDARKLRFQRWVKGLGRTTKYGLIKGAFETVGGNVKGATALDYTDNPGIAKGDVYLYIDNGSGTATGPVTTPGTELYLVQKHINGSNTEDDQGYKPAGINVEVKSSILTAIAVVTDVDVDPLYTVGDVLLAVKNAVINHLVALSLGEDVIFAKVSAVIADVPGVTDINTLTVNGGTSNIVVASNYVARANPAPVVTGA